MNIKLKVWHQRNQDSKGHFEEHVMSGIEEHMGFPEVLDLPNEQLFAKGKKSVVLDFDCREGICGQYGAVINGQVHGPIRSTACQLYMHHLVGDPPFKDSSTTTIESWRPTGFPVLHDLIVDRSVPGRIVRAGGYISVNTGEAPEAHPAPVQKEKADAVFEATAYIGRGACVAACPNVPTIPFIGAKVSHLGLLPQGQPEYLARVVSMFNQHDAEGLGDYTSIDECATMCPESVLLEVISRLNRDLGYALWEGQHTH